MILLFSILLLIIIFDIDPPFLIFHIDISIISSADAPPLDYFMP